MEFPYTYFEDEVREGFYISGNLKRAWAGQLEVLAEIDKVCKKHGIRWFIDCGTLLGAVRHGGYIPWDDDMDICMLHDDYVKFNRVAPYELPEQYVILNMHKEDDEILDYLTRVTNSHQVTFAGDYLEKYHNCPYSIGIDIFPLYYLCPDEEEEELRRDVCRKVMYVAETDESNENNLEKLEPQLLEVEEMCNVTIDRTKPIKKQLYKLTEALFSMYHADEADSVALMPYWVARHDHKYPMRCFKNTIMLPFENTYLPAPMMYDDVLKIEYRDYMRILKGGGVHDYPFYKKQEYHVIEAFPEYPFIYKFNPDHLKNDRFPIKISKRNVPDFLAIIDEAHNLIVKAFTLGQFESCVQLLGQCQQNAIQMGEQIESDFYEGHSAVTVLEEYCELVYEISQMATDGSVVSESIIAINDALVEIRDKIANELQQNVVNRREIVFVPFSARYWDAMESAWQSAKEQDNCDVYVMPIPYYERTINGDLTYMHYDGDQYPDYVPIVNYEEFDIVNRHPDVIYMQNPYDECNFTMCVEPKYFSRFMKKYTEELVYIPYFVMDEIESKDSKAWVTMEYFCTVPGLIHADKVILQSEKMREAYIERLTEFAGEETREIWETKIEGSGSSIYDVQVRCDEVNKEMLYENLPIEWKNVIAKGDGTYKKVVLFVTDIGLFAKHGIGAIEKIRDSILRLYKKRESIAILWMLQKTVWTAFSGNQELLDALKGLVEWYTLNQYGILDDSESIDRAIMLSDAYYGDSNRITRACAVKKKPVLIMNVDMQYSTRAGDEKKSTEKEVVFMPYKASMWDSLESVWMEEKDKPGVKTYVVPIPYYDKNPDGSLGELHYEGNQYPEYVPITDYREFDLELRHPDKIYIHNPYDDANYVTSVNPLFYSKKLKNYTDMLIYIPYFVLAEISPDDASAVERVSHFCTVPAVVNAHKVIVQSDNYRKVYINELTKISGEDLRCYWESKIVAAESPKFKKVISASKDDYSLPDEWSKLIQLTDKQQRKVILYNTGVTSLLRNGEKLLDKIESVFTYFSLRKDVVLWWRPHPLFEQTIRSMRPELLPRYQKLEASYINEHTGIFDDSSDLNRAIAWCDVYYGDGSSLVQLCQKAGKPVLIQNVMDV